LVCFDIAPPTQTIPGVIYTLGNISEFRGLVSVCIGHKVERILHLAGLIHHLTHNQPYQALQTNVVGLGNVLEVARILDLRHVVYASSVAVYGPQRLYDHPATESDATLPATLYGATKVMNEATAAHYRSMYGVNAIGLRPHVSFGAGSYDGAAGQFSALIKACARGNGAVWHRVFTPTTVISPMHAYDMAAAFAHVVSGDPLPGSVYNVGGAESLTERQMVGVVARVVGHDIEEGGSAGKEYDLEIPDIDCSRFREHSGFRQKYDFESAVRACLESERAR
jgi:nucleoside-diphosphate-sugar epimerase